MVTGVVSKVLENIKYNFHFILQKNITATRINKQTENMALVVAVKHKYTYINI